MGYGLKKIELARPDTKGGLPLYAALEQRRSERDYKNTYVSGDKLSQILWASQGVTFTTGYHRLRTAPSAGALFPVETYAVIDRVENFKPGIYHYLPPEHALVLIKEGDYGSRLARAALGQQMFNMASFVLVSSAVVERCRMKYGERAWRYIYLEAGHIAQNAALAAVSCGLGTCQVGAFRDDQVNATIGLDGVNETAVYLTAVGETI